MFGTETGIRFLAMKQSWPQVVWFCVGAVLGLFTERVLFPPWANFELLMPIGRWVASFGYKSLDWCWLLVYIWLVSWLIVVFVSIIGGLFLKRRPLLNVLLFGLGFAFVPLALDAYLNSFAPNFADYVQHLAIVGIAVVAGFLCQKCGVHMRRGSEKHPQGMADDSNPMS